MQSRDTGRSLAPRWFRQGSDSPRRRGHPTSPALEILEGRALLTVPIVEFPTGSVSTMPFQIAPGPDNTLWFADQQLNRIGRMRTDGTFVGEFPVISPSTIIEGMAAGPDGNMWVAQGWNGTEPTTYQVSRVTPAGDVTSYAASSPVETITAGPDGLMWFTERSGVVGSVDPATGTLTEYTNNTATGVDLNKHQAVFASDGALWFTEYGYQKVARFDIAAHTMSEVNIGSTADGPYGLAAGADGSLWYSTATSVCHINPATQKVDGSYPVADRAAIPEELTLAADGNVWFSSNYIRYGTAMASSRQVGQITPAGVMTAYPVPSSGADLNGVADGPDGNLWFSDSASQLGMATLPGSDVKVAVQNLTPTVSVGDTASFAITVTNNGPSTAKGVHFTSTLPAGLLYSSFVVVGPAGAVIPSTYTGGTLDSDLGDLRSGAAVTMRLKAIASAPGTFSEPASVTTRSLQMKPADNQASASITVNDVPLRIANASVSPSLAHVGDTVTYTIVLLNHGPSPATGVTVTDTLPAGLKFVSVVPVGSVDASGVVTSHLADLPNGGDVEVQITAVAQQLGKFDNTMTISSTGSGGGTAIVPLTVANASANLAVTMTASADTVRLHDQVTYQLNVSNNGPSTAAGVLVHDALPPGLQPVSVLVNGGSTNFTTNPDGSITFAAGDLPNGSSVPVAITAAATRDGSFTNRVSVASATPTTDTSQSNASVNTEVLNLAVTMTASATRVNTGDPLTYFVAVTNNGTVDAQGVRVSDILPAGLTFAFAEPSGGLDSTGNMVVCDLGSVQVGATINVKIHVTVSADTTLPGSIHNTALVGGDAPANTLASYSADVTVATGPNNVFVVTNTSDDGPGSLRQAILDVDSNPGGGTVVFQIPGTGVQTIKPLSPLPTATNPIQILGPTQPGYVKNTATTGDNEQPMIELDGEFAGVGANGLVIAAPHSLVQGLVINRFKGSGVVVKAGSTVVASNFIGLDPTGMIARGNLGMGVLIDAPGNSDLVSVGDLSPLGTNLISGNGAGVAVLHGDGNGIWNNLIGTDRNGQFGPGNIGAGVFLATNNNRVGVYAGSKAAPNVIAWNGGPGVDVAAGTGNTVRFNSIFINVGPGIDLGDDGPTANARGSRNAGPNGQPNFPVALVADYDPATNTTTISGALDAQDPTNETVDIYANAAVNNDHQGRTYLGSATPIAAEPGTTVGTFVLTVPGKVSGLLSATAMTADGSTSEFSPVQNATDTSGDGIADAWKTTGLDFNGDGVPDLVPGKDGFTPHAGQHDLFVEVDYMTGSGTAMVVRPDPQALTDVQQAFLNSGVPNSVGAPGVHLNIELNDSSPIPAVKSINFYTRGSGPNDDFLDFKNGSNDPTHPGSLTGTGQYDSYFGTVAERSLDPTTAYNLLSAKRLVFRFCVFGYTFAEGPRNSGVAKIGQRADGTGPTYGGSNEFVSVATWTSDEIRGSAAAKDDVTAARIIEESTFMHELGHTLGLQHGGGDGINNKLNYLSVMNYTFQFPSNVPSRPLDYSHQAMPSIDENHLNETTTLGGPASLMTTWTEVSPVSTTRPNGFIYVSGRANQAVAWLDASGGKPGLTDVSEYTRGYDSFVDLPTDYTSTIVANWGNGSRVPSAGKDAVYVGINSSGLLAIRVFDAKGNLFADIDETKISPGQADKVAALKSQIAVWLAVGTPLTVAQSQLLNDDIDAFFTKVYPLDFTTTVAADGTKSYLPVLRVLNGYNDWANLHYNFRLSPYLGNMKFGASNPNDSEPTIDDIMATIAARATNSAAARVPSAAMVAGPSGRVAPGQKVSLSATVTFASPPAAAPTGTVSFFDGPVLIGTSPLTAQGASYVASLSTAALAVGSHVLHVEYSGDGQVTGSTSDPLPLSVRPTTLSVTGPATGTVWASYALTLPAAPAGVVLDGWSINWGDGVTQSIAGGHAGVAHVYAAPGTYAITATASSSAGPIAAAGPVTVTVRPAVSGRGAAADAFVTTLYREILGRYPEQAGLTAWAARYVAHVSPAAITNAFFRSSERQLLWRAGSAPNVRPSRVLADALAAARHAGPLRMGTATATRTGTTGHPLPPRAAGRRRGA